MESSFTDEEKRFLLAEMIKYSHMDVNTLVEFIKLHEIQPEWMSFHLPRGRNMNECYRAADLMFRAQPAQQIPPPTISPLKRPSVGDIGEHDAKRQALGSPGDVSPFSITRSNITQSPGVGHQQQQQPSYIQPRPPNGYPPLSTQQPIAVSSVTVSKPRVIPMPGRRRGRPKKSDVSHQNPSRLRIMPYPPISPAPPIAPSPRSVTTPQPHSPGGNDVHPLYQLLTNSSQLRGRGSPLAAIDTPPPPESVPRTVQGGTTPGGGDEGQEQQQQARGPETEYQGGHWRENHYQEHQQQQQRNSAGPVPLEPPLTRHSNTPTLPPLPPPPSSHQPQPRQAAAAAAGLEQARREGQQQATVSSA
ncbi:hypothetical protein B0H66DRAFT_203403 [Apodospora peruviana]|uniref:Uncharacterized protein n=1 Tax=Apodospora peruviana TaxID=516989 RepID=A0AAE0M7L2_9PEZI|nr:hypothetical protein B0H66DRAFT_203403 [Apodospora peruviana]